MSPLPTQPGIRTLLASNREPTVQADTRRVFTTVLLVGVAVLTVGGCGNGGGDDVSGPTIPNIVGSYSGNWTLTAENRNTGESASISCPGNINVDSQNDGSFSGSYTIDAAGDCDASDSGTVDGEVRSDGGVNLDLGSASGSSTSFEDITGCTVTSGDSQLTGSVSGGNMSIDAEFFTDCPDGSGGTVPTRWVIGFSGS